MKPENPTPPTPVVEHLPTIFRKIKNGEYRVPPFQRDFVWQEKQILDLLESVYRGFPIGSVLLWRVERPVFRSVKGQATGFPDVKERYPASFVLDGVQRLSALNGVFNIDGISSDKRFDILFDLEGEVFVHARDRDRVEAPIPLSSIFHPRAFLDQQRELAAHVMGDLYLERAIRLLAVFQEYMVPVVSIADRNAEEVVSIFQRINSTGVRLGVVDFMRALTWSDDFDLTKELLQLQDRFESRGFVFDDETLLKALGIVFDLAPLQNVLLRLRGMSAKELHRGVANLARNIDRATDFVGSCLGLSSADALPYEAQWLFLVRLIHEDLDPFDRRDELFKWFLRSSFTESLQGRPDHALARMIDDLTMRLKVRERLPEFNPMDLDPDDITFKRFLRGKAVSVAFVEAMIRRGLFEGHPLLAIPYEEFLPIFPKEVLAGISRDVSSARTVGNVFYVPEPSTDRNVALDFIKSAFENGDQKAIEFCEKQFIDRGFVKRVRAGDVKYALHRRSMKIIREFFELDSVLSG